MKRHHLYSTWNQVPVTYYQQGVKHDLFQKLWHKHKINSAQKIVNNLTFKKCLDIGCASGYMISQIATLYPQSEYFGIDVYDKAISYARKHYLHIKFQVASADKLPFKNNSFDLIICYETIEHVEHPLECLKEMRRILNKDGTVILAMDSGSLLFRIVWFFWENTKGKVWKGAHLHPFHHSQLEQLIKRAGFKINRRVFSFLRMEVTFILNKR